MKRFLDIVLIISIILASLPIPASAATEIETFNVGVVGFDIGAKKSDILLLPSDSRIELKLQNILGKFGEDDTILEQQKYFVSVTARIKSGVSANFPKEMASGSVKIANTDVTIKVTTTENRKLVILSIPLSTEKSVETIEKEKTVEEAKHKHCFCGGYVLSGDHTEHSEVTFKGWNGKNKITYNSDGKAYVYLTDDVELCSTLSVGGKKTLMICMNGHSLKMTCQSRVINVNVGGKLYLCDCTRSAESKICGGSAEYGAGIHNNGTVNMFGGIITKNNGGYGGGVYNNGNFYLYGGDIYENKALYGGGVWNDNDSTKLFAVYEGAISYNTATCGGGIWNNDGGNITLKGGTIDKNIVGTGGGGLWNNGGTVNLDGSMFLENYAMYGGGIWNNGGLILIKSGNVSKNVATSNPLDAPNGNGGGIWNNGSGLIRMTGGEITFNKAGLGGGVWCCGESEFVMSGGVIAENRATGDGGGIYIEKSDIAPGNFRLSSKAGILMNIAGNAGGGALVRGVLNMEGEAEIIGNASSEKSNVDIRVADSGKVIKNDPLPTQFMDVKKDAYYLEPVKWAIEKNITTGTSEATFSPNKTCNRGQIITFLWRAAGEPKVKTSPLLADANEDDYYYMAAYWGQSLGLYKTALYPGFSCNRLTVIYYLWCAAGKPECKAPVKFKDVQEGGYKDYHDAIAWAVENGITKGTSETTFSPGKSCTRAQVLTFLWRASAKGLI